MATLGNKRRVYLTDKEGSTHTWLTGEQTNSFNRSAESVEISDKSTVWAQFLSGKKSATADVTISLDDKATSKQKDLLASFTNGTSVFCFIGSLESENTRAEGDAFEAIITSISDTNEQGAVASRQVSLQVTGEPVHYPSLG